MELPEEWKNLDFGSRKVQKAFYNHCVFMIETLNPDYFAYGIEVDLLFRLKPELWDKFLKLARKTYNKLKRKFPDLPVFVTLYSGPENEVNERVPQIRQILPYTDFIAISTYPFLTPDPGGNPADIPENWLTKLTELAPEKPVAITETAMSAEDVVIESQNLTIPCNSTWQKRYVNWLMKECNRLEAEFIVWFVPADYDKMWEAIKDSSPEWAILWKDAGLYDEKLEARPALKIWNKWYRRPVK
jgi:arabinogalactan endo-1,4-beta-galactosidase